MQVLTNINSLNQYLEKFRIRKKGIGFVPTMGALHEGHLSLVKLAQKDCDVVVCSIFINPTQFNDSNDLENYPITIEEDIKLLEEQSCDILFQPNVTEMYPEGLNTKQYLLNGIDKVLEGRKRPGHFDGVCTIVHRLFSIVRPQIAYFGEKDFQQVAVIRQMVNSLSLPIQIKTGKTIIDLDKKFLRPTEVEFLKGNFSKARRYLKWKPSISTDDLIDDMIRFEMSKYNS